MTGPAVVAVGGGHGLAASLRAVRTYAGSVTAVVSVADDGGSSGRLREATPSLPAPGDVRRCLSALADPGSALGRVLEHRYGPDDGELDGHALGNLVLAAFTRELGSFPAAVDEVARLAGCGGRVLPATTEPVWLEGVRAADGPAGADGAPASERVVGQVAVQNSHGLTRVLLRPDRPESPPEVAAAILAADQVVVGPGSLFTSVLAAAVVPAVREALHATRAQRVYVANLRPQEPETGGFSGADHLRALALHGVTVDVALFHPGSLDRATALPVPCVERRVADDRGVVHHAGRLADALGQLLATR